MLTVLPLSSIELDVELQPREDIDQDLVATYAEAIQGGAAFPPVIVFKNGSAEHLLADGWHRYYAHQLAKLEAIAVEILDGDRMAALRYSLGANATHGRQRSDLTIRRAYDRAKKHGLVEPSDREAVRDLLKISPSYARKLTQDAYQAHLEATKSLAYALAAKGWSQQKIAKRLEVPQRTISDWLSGFATGGESANDLTRLPAKDELESIAEEIDAAARAELEPLIRSQMREDFEAELQERIGAVKKQLEAIIAKEREGAAKAREKTDAAKAKAEQEIARLKNRLKEAVDAITDARDEAARKAAEATAKRLTGELESKQAALEADRQALAAEREEFARALEAAERTPLGETEAEAQEREKIAALRQRYPDLADKVQAEICSLEDANAEARQRDRIDENDMVLVFGFLHDGFRKVCEFSNPKRIANMKRWLENPRHKAQLLTGFADLRVKLDQDAFAAGSANVLTLIDRIKE